MLGRGHINRATHWPLIFVNEDVIVYLNKQFSWYNDSIATQGKNRSEKVDTPVYYLLPHFPTGDDYNS